MPITLITGPANAGKAQLVMESARRHLAHGSEPILVLPTRTDVEHYLRELAGEGTAMGARAERFDGLIAETVLRAGLTEPVLGGLARERLLAALAARAGSTPASPGFLRALAAVLSELLVRRVSPARLREAMSRWAAVDGTGAAGGGLDRLFAEYLGTLRELGCLDEDQRAVRALDALRRRPSLWGGRPVLFYGFDDLTALQLDTIETLGVIVGAEVTVALAYEPGRTAFAGRASTFQALEPLAAEHRALPARAEHYAPASRTALSHIERSLFEPDAARVDPGGAVRLLEGGGERAELELVAGEIRALLDAGMDPEEIAVVIRTPAASGNLLKEVFSAAGIPHALQRSTPFADTAVGGALIGLLRSVPRRDGASGGPAPEPSAAAEGPVAGSARDLLAWLRAPGLLERPELADELELRIRRAGVRDAAQARRMWEDRHWRLDAIDRLRDAAGRAAGGEIALIERAARELQWLFSAPRRRSASILDAAELAEARALAAGRSALAELRELARRSPALAPRDAAELAAVLEAVEVFSGARPGPGAVAVLDPLALRARRVRALFLCCLQESVFPAPARTQPFLAEEERRRLAETSGLRLGRQEDPLAAERYLLYAAVSRPEELLCLSWHVADDDGEPTARSLFVDDLCDLFTADLGERRRRRPLGAVDRPPGPAPAGREEGLAPLRAEEVLAELRARPWSGTSLETWISCPARWFAERLLDPGRFDPEAEPLARGALSHLALRDTLAGLARERGSARLTPATLGRARELLRRALEENEAEHPLSAASERVPAARRRLRADLERFLEHAAGLGGGLEPRHLELGFGFAPGAGEGAGEELPALDLGGGVMLRGRIDRVDVEGGAGGKAVVYDYKNRNAPAPANWIRDGSIQVAMYMRVVEQLLGLRVAGGFYQPLSGEDLRARGVLEEDSGLEIDCVRGDERPADEVRDLVDEALALAREAAAQARAGELESRPQTCGWNGAGCVYPTICRCER